MGNSDVCEGERAVGISKCCGSSHLWLCSVLRLVDVLLQMNTYVVPAQPLLQLC
jgi:hypothetical protein